MMSEDKLRSDEVPEKFVEWLLAMGCPPGKVPSAEKITEMCRGQYYMVWRSLIEKVEAKDVIRNKRLQVFCDDVKKCEKKSVFSERNRNVIEPEELSLWKQHSQAIEMVADAEVRVNKENENLQQLMSRGSSKLSQHKLIYKRLQDAQRRCWLLNQLADELKGRRAQLSETKTIAESFSGPDDGSEIESKLDKCILDSHYGMNATVKSGGISSVSGANPGASTSIASTTSEYNDDEIVSSVLKCRGDVLFKQLYEKRAGLCDAVPTTRNEKTSADNKRVTPQSVLSHTSALHCSLALEAVKNRIHLKNTRDRLAICINELSGHLSGEACELLVMRCERARSEAHLAAVRATCDDLTAKSGIFATESHHAQASGALKSIHSIDKAIKSKRDELKKLISSVAMLEVKTQNVKDCLVSLFNSFHDDANNGGRFSGRSSFPQDSVLILRQFYEEQYNKRKSKVDVSADFDISDNSFSDPEENESPKFTDELKLYLKKFNLENNRKLVFENGENIWAFETLQSSLNQIHTEWQTNDVTTNLLCSSVTLKQNLQRLAQDVSRKIELQDILHVLDSGTKKSVKEIDISSITEEEQKILDSIKKKLNDNSLCLQKTNKALDVVMDNLRFWADNNMKKYISTTRSVNGRNYKEYEDLYLQSLKLL